MQPLRDTGVLGDGKIETVDSIRARMSYLRGKGADMISCHRLIRGLGVELRYPLFHPNIHGIVIRTSHRIVVQGDARVLRIGEQKLFYKITQKNRANTQKIPEFLRDIA